MTEPGLRETGLRSSESATEPRSDGPGTELRSREPATGMRSGGPGTELRSRESGAAHGAGLRSREPVGVRAAGLRERKKASTREALHRAAMKLATEHGADRVTVEAIADEAGVSRRTFSNYFASKEQALLYGDHRRMQALLELVRGRPADEGAWPALVNAAADFYRQLGELDPELVSRGRLVRRHPALAAEQITTFAAGERELSAELARRLPGPDPTGVRAALRSAIFLAALRVAVNVWLDQPPGTRIWDLVEATLAEAGSGFED